MAEISKIQWTDATFNPWIGCTKVSQGCANCYASVAYPTKMMGIEWGKDKPRHRTSENNWKEPQKWNRKAIKTQQRTKVFCASLCDVFDPEVPQEWRDDLWELIEKCSMLDWQLLTKRLNVMSADELLSMVPISWRSHWPENVWFGHSITIQDELNRVIPKLAKVSAKIRFLSCEPLLEEIDLTPAFALIDDRGEPWAPLCNADGSDVISWVVIGGESGSNARPFKSEWAELLLDQCADADVAAFMKQMGTNSELKLSDRKGGNWDEWPEQFRVRQFPV